MIEAFEDAIKAVKNDDGQAGYLLQNILIREFDKQKIATHEFRRHLGFINRIRFNKAWKTYHGGYEDYPDFKPYFMTDNGQKLFNHRVDKILKFSNKT